MKESEIESYGEFEIQYEAGRNPLGCATYLLQKFMGGETSVADLHADPGYLFSIDGKMNTTDSELRETRLGHDLSVLFVFASHKYMSEYELLEEGILGNQLTTPWGLSAGLLCALAERRLAIFRGSTIIHPASTLFVL